MKIKDIIKSLAFAPSGIHSYFVKINDKIGIKITQSAEEHYNIAEWQTFLSSNGLAPELIHQFEFDYHYSHYYCSIMEVVEVLDLACESDFESFDYARIVDEEDEKYQHLVDELDNDLISIGVSWRDRHCGNIGFKNGKIVLIDMGELYDIANDIEEDFYEMDSRLD